METIPYWLLGNPPQSPCFHLPKELQELAVEYTNLYSELFFFILGMFDTF